MLFQICDSEHSAIQDISTNYKSITYDEAIELAKLLSNSWKNPDIPLKQRRLVEQQLQSYKNGEVIQPYEALLNLLNVINPHENVLRLLEIGCSSGYYSEVIRHAGFNVTYTGCDYSSHFIQMARKYYPKLQFDVEDASNLNYSSKSFDVVISGCCILHMINYLEAISEVARVTKRWAIFHRTPIVSMASNQFYTKDAYGVKTLEIYFNEEKFISDVESSGMKLIKRITVDEDYDSTGALQSATKSYLFEKTSN